MEARRHGRWALGRWARGTAQAHRGAHVGTGARRWAARGAEESRQAGVGARRQEGAGAHKQAGACGASGRRVGRTDVGSKRAGNCRLGGLGVLLGQRAVHSVHSACFWPGLTRYFSGVRFLDIVREPGS